MFMLRLFTVIVFCLLATAMISHYGVNATTEVAVEPVPFFDGPLLRLQMHLDFVATACFKITQNGPRQVIPRIELWSNGKRVDREHYAFKSSSQKELSLSVSSIGDADRKPSVRVGVGGGWNFVRYFELPAEEIRAKGFLSSTIDKPVVLTNSQDKAIVWCLAYGKGIALGNLESVQAELEKSPWALVMRIELSR